jgi:hypothetical protein
MTPPTETATSAEPTIVPAGNTCALDEAAMNAFARDAKIGLLATVDAAGRPHLTLITSIQARGSREMMFGQFTEGLSKAHLKHDPKAGFLVMTPERDIWRGKLRWTHAVKAGEDYELYNRKPMFRYNAYCGIHTVHHLALVDLAGTERLSAARLAAATLALVPGRLLAMRRQHVRALSPWTMQHLAKVTTLKFASWVAPDGYPVITPPIACRAADGGRLVVQPTHGRHGVERPADGQTVAVFAVNPAMESVLIRGRCTGWRRHAALATGVLDVEWVYNSMPPKQGQVYPAVPIEPVTTFGAPRVVVAKGIMDRALGALGAGGTQRP